VAEPTPVGELRRDLLLLALVGAFLFLPALGQRDLWNPDEARYAEVAREMTRAGSWFVPRLNDGVYSEKPPLLFWSIAAASVPFGGVTETSTRLPSALAALAALLLVFRLGERFFGRRVGLLAGLIFATSAKVLWQGRFGQIDMLLTALVAAAVWFWVRGYTERRRGFYWLFFLFAGLATLAKGPVGLLPPLLSIVAFLLVTGDGGEIKRMRLGRGLLLWAAVVLLWLGPAALQAGSGYLETMVFKQNVTRYADPWHHYQPWYYYLTVIPADFFPWSFLLPAALVVGWRRLVAPAGTPLRAALRGGADGDVGSDGDGEGDWRRRGFLFALCWVLVTLVFFSVSPAKRSVYVLTLYPALALLAGAGLDRLAAAWEGGEKRPRRAWLTVPLGLLTLLVAAAAVALPVAGLRRPEAEILGASFVLAATAAFAALALAAAAAFVLSLGRRARAATAALAMGMAVLFLTAAFVLLPRFDVFKSARPLSEVLLARMAPGDEYAIYPRLDNTFLFYTNRTTHPIGSPQELRDFLARPGRGWLLIERDAWAKIPDPPPLLEVARDRDPKEGYLLLVEPAP